ncbi:MAG: T9SS type A sorting domain-containing protein, partial [Saprospiraceae bacterium]
YTLILTAESDTASGENVIGQVRYGSGPTFSGFVGGQFISFNSGTGVSTWTVTISGIPESINSVDIELANTNQSGDQYGYTGFVWNASGLPVEFSTFEVSEETTKQSKLQWQTSLELNNSHFNIQRSPNGEAWKTIGMVKGAGTTDEPQSYVYMDEHPYPGMNYYRLEQVDLDGTTDYSWVVSTDVKGDFTIIPNPSTESQMTQLFFSEAAPIGSSVNVLDVSGRVVFEQQISEDQSFLEINLPELASGIYFARLTLPDGKTGAQGKIVKK